MAEDELIMVRVSKQLIEKVIAKLNLNPATPTVYVVDQALRNFAEEA